MTNLFDTIPTVDPEKDYTPELVGEGKKFKDIPSLARGKVQSDNHITQLERELREAREDLSKLLPMNEVLTELRKSKTEATPVTNPNDPPATNVLTKEDLTNTVSEIVNKTVLETQAEAKARANVEQVTNTLSKVWGRDFSARLEAKAAELELGKEFLTNLARTQPKAFLSLVGVSENAAPASPFAASTTGINTAAILERNKDYSGEKKYSYYQKVRKEQPTVYHSRTFQMEMHNQAQKLGEAFFDT